mgnify:CR=1 FL=1
MFKSREYWINYNTIEFAAWMAKLIIIVPGLIFGIELWYLHFLTLRRRYQHNVRYNTLKFHIEYIN